MTDLDPLLPEAQVDPDSRPAMDWPTDPWDATDQTGQVERLRRQTRPLKWMVYATIAVTMAVIIAAGALKSMRMSAPAARAACLRPI